MNNKWFLVKLLLFTPLLTFMHFSTVASFEAARETHCSPACHCSQWRVFASDSSSWCLNWTGTRPKHTVFYLIMWLVCSLFFGCAMPGLLCLFVENQLMWTFPIPWDQQFTLQLTDSGWNHVDTPIMPLLCPGLRNNCAIPQAATVKNASQVTFR